jgi:hypothetical protein
LCSRDREDDVTARPHDAGELVGINRREDGCGDVDAGRDDRQRHRIRHCERHCFVPTRRQTDAGARQVHPDDAGPGQAGGVVAVATADVEGVAYPRRQLARHGGDVIRQRRVMAGVEEAAAGLHRFEVVAGFLP